MKIIHKEISKCEECPHWKFHFDSSERLIYDPAYPRSFPEREEINIAWGSCLLLRRNTQRTSYKFYENKNEIVKRIGTLYSKCPLPDKK